MIVWRIRGKIIRTVLCCVVYDSCVQLYAHTYEQFMKMRAGLGLFFGRFLGLAFCVFVVCSCIVCFCCVWFRFFSTVPRDWLGRTFPK